MTASARNIKRVLVVPMRMAALLVEKVSRQRVVNTININVNIIMALRIRTDFFGIGVSTHPRMPMYESL